MKTARTGRWMCAALAAVALTTTAQSAEQPKVEVRGIRIVGEGSGKKRAGMSHEVRPFNWTKGVTISVLVRIPDGGILKLDRDASKVTKLVDDKGTKLMSEKGGRTGLSPFISVTGDGTACMAELRADKLPANDATRIVASGTFVFMCAKEKKTFTHENVALKAGTDVSAGTLKLKVAGASKPKWGRSPWMVTLESAQDCSSLAAIRVLDENGKDLADQVSMSTSRMGPVIRVKKHVYLKKKIEKATVAVDRWTDMRAVKVPFSLEAGIGL